MSQTRGDTAADLRAEFDAHVWDHTTDVFQTSFDLRAPLNDATNGRLTWLVHLLRDGATDAVISDALLHMWRADRNFLLTIVQLIGLTRAKVRTDIHAALAQRGEACPSNVVTFPTRDRVWSLTGPYFSKRIRSVFTNLLSIDDGRLPSVFEAMNQATWPGYTRQEKAKRSGGIAEQRLAILLHSLAIPFEPTRKVEDGLTRDVTLAGESFDLVIPDADRPLLAVMAMTHAANIGQYGESKVGDIAKARTALNAFNPTPLLGIFADGVGFYGNSAGLRAVLANSDEFFQFATMWKLAVVAAYVTRARLAIVLPDPEGHRNFLNRFASTTHILEQVDNETGWTEGGEATIRRL